MKLSFLLFLYIVCVVKCSNILIVCPVPSRSHFILGNALAKGLIHAGHEVTVVSPYEDKNPLKNYKDVVLTGLREERMGTRFNAFDLGNINPVLLATIVMDDMGYNFLKKTFSHPNFQKFIKSDQHFDLIIIQNFKNDALNVLQCHFNAPLIIFSVTGPSFWVNPFVGNPSPPAYIPDFFLSYSSYDMNFQERAFNSFILMMNYISKYVYSIPRQKVLMTEYFPRCQNHDEILNNVSLVFLNSHESFSQAVPLVPNMINIGGFHVNPPNELSKDLKDFMDNAHEGVVYFSLGTNVNGALMKTHLQEAILKALGKLKQKVLYKHSGNLANVPKNIKLGEWFPQTDILAHPNTKLFITHGGLLSTYETLHHGVPVLVLPVFADQKMNGAQAQAVGYGITIPFAEITEERLNDALNNLLTDKRYRNTAKIRSVLSHDRPIQPMDLAVYWSEFVIRHRGAPHLRNAGMDLKWYQYLLLDVIAFVMLGVSFIVFVIYMTCRTFCLGNKKFKQE